MADPGLVNPHSPYEIELLIAKKKPVAIICRKPDPSSFPISDYLIEELNKHIEEKKLVLIGEKYVPNIGVMAVVAQNSKVSAGRELYARYYLNDEGYKTLENDEWHMQVGKLLGYTKRDIELVKSRGERSRIMKYTEPFRLKIRHKYMMEYCNSYE